MCTPVDPGAAGGIDLESDLIEELAAEHANIIGVKLTFVSTIPFCDPPFPHLVASPHSQMPN